MLFAGLGSVRAAEGSIFRSKVTIFHYTDLPYIYYMALSNLKDWELPNSRIWLAENDIDRGLDFPI